MNSNEYIKENCPNCNSYTLYILSKAPIGRPKLKTQLYTKCATCKRIFNKRKGV